MSRILTEDQKFIKFALWKMRLTKTELAEKLGTHRATINLWVLGTANPKPIYIKHIQVLIDNYKDEYEGQ